MKYKRKKKGKQKTNSKAKIIKMKNTKIDKEDVILRMWGHHNTWNAILRIRSNRHFIHTMRTEWYNVRMIRKWKAVRFIQIKSHGNIRK